MPTLLAKAIRDYKPRQPTLVAACRLIEDYTSSDAWPGPTMAPTPSMLCAWRKGDTKPGDDYIDALAAVFHVDRDALADDFAEHAATKTPKPRKRRTMNQPPSVAEPLRAVKATMQRRDALKLSATTLGGAGFALIDTEPLQALQAVGQRAAPAGYLDALEGAVDHYASMLWAYDPRTLDGELSAYFVKVRGLLESAGIGPAWSRLCWIGAKLAALIGWLRWMTGRHGDAHAYYQAALELAEQTGDRPLLGHIAADEAMVAYYDRRYADAIELTAQGQRLTTAPVAVTRLACQQARAAARSGYVKVAKEAILVAREHLDAGRLTATQDRFSLPATAALYHLSTAQLWLGEPKTAKQLALSAIAACDGPRDEASNKPHARLAAAAADARLGNLDAAVGEASAVVRADPRVDAFSIMARARDLLVDLAPHRANPIVREYRELLDSVGSQKDGR